MKKCPWVRIKKQKRTRPSGWLVFSTLVPLISESSLGILPASPLSAPENSGPLSSKRIAFSCPNRTSYLESFSYSFFRSLCKCLPSPSLTAGLALQPAEPTNPSSLSLCLKIPVPGAAAVVVPWRQEQGLTGYSLCSYLTQYSTPPPPPAPAILRTL